MTTVTIKLKDNPKEEKVQLDWAEFREIFKSGIFGEMLVEWMECNGKRIVFE